MLRHANCPDQNTQLLKINFECNSKQNSNRSHLPQKRSSVLNHYPLKAYIKHEESTTIDLLLQLYSIQSTMTGIGESHRIPEEKPSAPIQASSEPTNNVSIENYLHPQPQQVPVQHAPKAQVHHPFIRKQNSVTSSVDGVVQGSLSTSSIHGSTIVPEASTVSIIGATQTAGQNPGNVQDTQATANNAQSNGLGTGNGETKSRGESTSDPSASTSRSSTPSEVVSEDSGEGEKKTGGKSKAAKKDRSKLRKGKWTVSEDAVSVVHMCAFLIKTNKTFLKLTRLKKKSTLLVSYITLARGY
jgi:hypothetical protein